MDADGQAQAGQALLFLLADDLCRLDLRVDAQRQNLDPEGRGQRHQRFLGGGLTLLDALQRAQSDPGQFGQVFLRPVPLFAPAFDLFRVCLESHDVLLGAHS